MDGRISMYVLLVCVWCSLDAGGLLMVVTAEPTVSAVILTPDADRKEGGQVDMKCNATNLESHHIVSWAMEDPDRVLRLGGVTLTTESRYTFSTQADTTTGITVQDFTIINVQTEDSNEYFCKVNYRTTDGTYNVVASSSVTLSVSYFPSASFPICFPAGPITVDDGTVLNMRCTSESSHRTVRMTFNSTTHTSRYTSWKSQTLDENDTLIRTSDLTADVADDCIAINCIIKSTHFPNMERSCTFGPITITPSTAEPTISRTCTSDPTISISGSSRSDQLINQTNQGETESRGVTSQLPLTDTQTFLPTTDSRSLSTPWILALAFLLVFSFIIIIFLILCIMRKNRLIKSLTAQKESKVPKADPYMELQPTEDKNRVYMEPTTAATTTQDTHYQPVEVETDSPEDDYARPEGSTNTSYETVRKPRSANERPYQNINK